MKCDLRSLVKEPTYFKNPENPSCIGLILTNKPRNFIKTGVIETGLSYYQKMKMHDENARGWHLPESNANIENSYRSSAIRHRLSSLKYLNALFATNFQHFTKTFFQSFTMVFVRAITPNIVAYDA